MSQTTPDTAPSREAKIAAKAERLASEKALADRVEATKIADELVALKVTIKGIDANQSNAVDGLVARIRGLGIAAPQS